MNIVTEPAACVATSATPAAGCNRYRVTFTDLDVYETTIDAPDALTAERFACSLLHATPSSKHAFRHLDGGIDHVESEIVREGGAA